MSIAGLINENNMGLITSQPIISEPTGLMAVTGNMVNATLKNFNSFSSRNLQNKQIDKQYEDIQKITGQRLEEIIGKDYDSDNRWNATDKYILEQRGKNPEWDNVLTTSEMREAAKQEAQEANIEYQVTASGAGGFSKITGTVLGGLAGAMTDPLNLGATVVSAGAASAMRLNLLKTVALETGVNVGVETLNQPFIASWQSEMGNEYGLGEALTNVAFAGVAGAAFTGLPPVIKAGAKEVRAKGAVIFDNIATNPRTPEYIKEPARIMAHRANVAENTPFVKDTPQARNEHEYNVKKMDEVLSARQSANDADLKFTEKTVDEFSFDDPFLKEAIEIKKILSGLSGKFDINKPSSLKSALGYTPKSLSQYIKEIGGIQDKGGELKSMDINKKSVGLIAKGKKTQGTAKGVEIIDNTIDTVKQRVFDAGYFPHKNNYDDITNDELFEAINNDVYGRKIYSQSDLDDISQNTKLSNSALEKQYDEYGINADSSISDIIDTLKRIKNIETDEAVINYRNQQLNGDENYLKSLEADYISKPESEYLSTDIRKSDSYETLSESDLSRKDNRMLDDLSDLAQKSGDEILEFDGQKISMKELYEEIQAGENLLKAVKVCAL